MKNEKIILISSGLAVGIFIGFLLGKLLSGGGATTTMPPPPPAMPAPSVNYDQQIKNLKALLAQDSGNYRAWVDLGNAYFDSNQPANAVDAYSKALAIDGSSADVHTDIGIMYRAQGRLQEALTEFSKAAQLDPMHFNSRLNTGIVYVYDLFDYKSGLKAWEDLLKIHPTGPRSDQLRQRMETVKQEAAMRGGSQAPSQAPTMPPPVPKEAGKP